MIRGRNIICLASSWGIDPTSKHQVMRRLAAENEVLWVNYHGSRLPRPNMHDVLHSVRTLSSVTCGSRRVSDGITTMTPMLVPVPGSPAIRGINRKMVLHQIRRAMRGWPRRPIQVWSFAPDVADLIDSLSEEVVVYYCVDEFSEFAGYDGELVRRLERELIGKSDIVLTSAEGLYEAKRHLHPRTHLIRHGVDVDHFGKALMGDTSIPRLLADLPRPVIGFFGLISDWFDMDLMRELADLRPNWSFVLIGAAGCDVSGLGRRPNVHLTGRVSYDELPGYCRGFDVAVIPFVANELTRHVNPIKLREYLAAGLPVVSTPLPEVRVYEPHVRIADSAEAFVAACQEAVASDSPERRRWRASFVAGEGWDGRVEEISELVMSACRDTAPA
ncbi:MAG: glycosyltransferase [Phycisphaerales bacterium]|nr:MAG: glycosyltransferase [Phycisphaerales bacterium]